MIASLESFDKFAVTLNMVGGLGERQAQQVLDGSRGLDRNAQFRIVDIYYKQAEARNLDPLNMTNPVNFRVFTAATYFVLNEKNPNYQVGQPMEVAA